MAENNEASNSERESLLSKLKTDKPGALPAAVILALLALTLIFFGIARKSGPPADTLGVNETTMTVETTETVSRAVDDLFRTQLNAVIEAAKKRPFRAKITTEAGFKGFWTQSGGNYRFEDPSKTGAIIINSAQKILWIVNVPRKVASETTFNETNLESSNELLLALLMEGLSTQTATGARAVEDILPRGKNAKLTYTKEGLPDRWEGPRSNGTTCFIDWDYVQLGTVPPAEFELPKGFAVNRITPSATATANK